MVVTRWPTTQLLFRRKSHISRGNVLGTDDLRDAESSESKCNCGNLVIGSSDRALDVCPFADSTKSHSNVSAKQNGHHKDARNLLNLKVRTAGFELTASCTPSKRAIDS